MKKTSKWMLLTFVLASVFAFSTGIFADDANVADAVVTVSAQSGNIVSVKDEDFFKIPTTFHIYGDAAEKMGYTDGIAPTEGVSVLDVLVAYHEWFYATEEGNAFAVAPQDYLVVNNGWVSTAFGVSSGSWAIAVNGEAPHTDVASSWGGFEGLTVDKAPVVNGDDIFFARYLSSDYKEKMVWFMEDDAPIASKSVAVGETFSVAVKGYPFTQYGSYGTEALYKDYLKPYTDSEAVLLDLSTGKYEFVRDVTADDFANSSSDGIFRGIRIDEPGQYILTTVSGDYGFNPSLYINVHNVYDYSSFSDLKENDWFKAPVTTVLDNGLMNGIGNQIFAPDMSLTREMFVTILYRAVGSPVPAYYYDFKDIDEKSYSYDAINWACEAGIVYGVADKELRFAPTENITREQMATIMDRFAYAYDIDLPQDKPATTFKDAAKVSIWAKDSVEYLTKAGILNGYPDGTFQPQGNATRAEAAKIITSFMDL